MSWSRRFLKKELLPSIVVDFGMANTGWLDPVTELVTQEKEARRKKCQFIPIVVNHVVSSLNGTNLSQMPH